MIMFFHLSTYDISRLLSSLLFSISTLLPTLFPTIRAVAEGRWTGDTVSDGREWIRSERPLKGTGSYR